MEKKIIGMDNNSIISAVRGMRPNIGNCEINRRIAQKTSRYTSIGITVTLAQEKIKLIEKIYHKKDKELYNYSVVNSRTLAVPQIYYLDEDEGVLLMEDLSEDYVQGCFFDEENDNGSFVRENYGVLIRSAAKFHAAFWEHHDSFERIGLDWRLENREHILTHINGMEKDYKQYRTAEESGKIPKVWNNMENNIVLDKLDYFQTALNMLRARYVELIDARFQSGKSITVIHGDLHPGNTFISKTSDRAVKFIDMQAVRMGLCTEDLAMLLALHIAPEKQFALPLLGEYHRNLCENVSNYSFAIFMDDYKISILENMFFPLYLMKRDIFAFDMRDRAMRAFETFVLGKE
jgi:tRNA A-37 threonylcarbamoyl transferase component Bud32